MLEYMTPHDIDYRILDIDLSQLGPKDPNATKPVIVFDKATVGINFAQKKSDLPPKEVDTFEVSKFVKNFVCKWLSYEPLQIQTGNQIIVKQNKDIRVVARSSSNWALHINSFNEERNLFKAVSLYILEYLFKTRAGGYFIALSGGSDSTLNALFVYFACQTLNYFVYQKINHEVVDKMAYILGLPVSLKKVDLSEDQRKSQFFLTSEDLSKNRGSFALGSEVGDSPKGDTWQYFVGNEPVTVESLSRKILNVGYLPMDFSGSTKPFVENLKSELKCNSVEFSIQNVFNAFKGETESMLCK